MKEKLPVNAEILKWARTSLGMSREDAAQKLGTKIEAIRAWESGTDSPTYPQLERLAHGIYKRPVAVFFFPSIPEEESPRTEFRTLPDTVIDELPSGIIKLYRKAKLFQLNLEELYESEKPVSASLLDAFDLRDARSFDTVIIDLRKMLGISIEEQASWRSTEIAVKKWREAFEANGVFVFKDGFRNDDYSGFCLYDGKYPIVFINNSMPDSRQVFTLFHELGHLLHHSGGIDFRSGEAVRSFAGYYRKIEATCNRFANEFLVPEEMFDQFEPKLSEAHFSELANYFSVSREVILRKYLDRGLVEETLYDEMTAKWNAQAKKKREESEGHGNYYYNVKTYLGATYVDLVYRRYYQSKITADAAAEYLNVKAKNLSTFEHVVMGGHLS